MTDTVQNIRDINCRALAEAASKLMAEAWTEAITGEPAVGSRMPRAMADILEACGWTVRGNIATSPEQRGARISARFDHAGADFHVLIEGGRNQWDAWGADLGRTPRVSDLIVLFQERQAIASDIGALEAALAAVRLP